MTKLRDCGACSLVVSPWFAEIHKAGKQGDVSHDGMEGATLSFRPYDFSTAVGVQAQREDHVGDTSVPIC
jgi:hypothetical protein